MESKVNIPKAFFSFLIASFFIWLLINLSKEYTTIVNYKIIYEKLPQHKVFQEEPLKEIEVLVKASGFKLLSSNFYNKSLIFYLDKIRNNAEKQYYILPRDQKRIVQAQLYKGLHLENFLKDTVFLNLGSLASKKVPVFLNLKIDYKHGYDLASPIKITPDSVVVSGPKLQLDKISTIRTSDVELEHVYENTKEILKLQTPVAYPKIKINDKEVTVEILVDKFTEGSFFVPFLIKNVPEETKINTYPKEVKITFNVGLSNFNKITPGLFKIVCDYKESKENDLPYLIPRLDVVPNLISSVKIAPNKIEFLTQK